MDPQRLAIAALLAGYRPPPTQDYTYCDLGMGRGMTLNMLATANPGSSFWGCDYDTAHIDDAKAMAAQMGAANTNIFDDDFASFATRDLPQFDYIGLHGIVSWVDADVRADIAGFLQKFLKPGGIVQLSYTALPAWAGLSTLRQIMIAHMGERTQDLERAKRAIDYAAMMAKMQPPGLGIAPVGLGTVDGLLTDDLHYLVHEYLGYVQTPFHAHDVDQWLSPLGFQYVASAGLDDPFRDDQIPLQMKMMAQVSPDPAYRRTMMDMVEGRLFRKDIFMRTPEALDQGQRSELMDQIRIGLTDDAAIIRQKISEKMEGTTAQAIACEIVDGLSAGPRMLGDMMLHVNEMFDRVLGVLLASQHITLAPGADQTVQVGKANDLLLDNAQSLQGHSAMIAPEVRAGVRVSWQNQMFMLAERRGEDPGEFCLATMHTLRERLSKSLVATLDSPDASAKVAENYARFDTKTRPVLQALGI